ncbi:YdiY family protein [Aliikangiella sp. G2MR2-5]|uniref:DUF481 domain-containing protein n=1 Tax=Aliikangiella sp. G2MR2-5 TaxID=2788943 RepID=UPI0018AC4DAA|nr:DUF481 domain-containing protein [Aliikangiella sp. G2MR2-5]
MGSLFKVVNAFIFSVMFAFPAVGDDFWMGRPSDESDEEVVCEPGKEDCDAKWEGSVEFGYVAVSGNQETDSLNGRFALSYEVEKWRHGGFVATQSSSTDDKINDIQTEARKLVAQLKSQYKYSDNAYAFGIYDFDDTKDSGFDYQSSIAFGAGYSFLNSEEHTLEAELGLGIRETKNTFVADNPDTVENEEVPSVTSSEQIARLAGLYKWNISENSNFEQTISAEIGEDNDVYKSYSAISANIIENLALKISYTAKYQSEVPEGNEDLETVSSFTVVYSF